MVAETVKKTAFRITRMGQLVAQEASRRLDVPFGIVDLSLAPTPAIGDSVARILEEMGLEVCGTHGTTAALALLNDAVKKGGVMASSSVGGLSGAFIPVSEDEGMIAAASSGALPLDKLEAMTCVCSVGLDMIAVLDPKPGDLSGLDFLRGRTCALSTSRPASAPFWPMWPEECPTCCSLCPSARPYWAGQLVYFFEYACGLSGYLLGVNPFNQPGVEAYKTNMFALLGKPGHEARRKALLDQTGL